MQKISAWTDLATPAGAYRYGSLVGGVAPTPIKAEWLNMVQDELCNFILAYLPALDKADSTQVLKAAQKMVANFALKATTLAGYGITDAYTKPQTDSMLAQKANWAITIGGYGITDAYTKTEVNTLLNSKANNATTLAGYGITDAYTKAETYSRAETYTRTETESRLSTKQDLNSAAFGTASWQRDGSTGAIEQYGILMMDGSVNEQTITFPVAFPNACRYVGLTNMEDSAPENNIVRILRWTQNSVTIVNSGGNAFTSYTWLAKGN